MGTSANFLLCDGCGADASPEHIAGRLRRLELCTRFRPVHIGVLYVALAPPADLKDDFYGPAESREFSDAFLEALEILPLQKNAAAGSESRAAHSARLAEFQHHGYYLTYLSECPLPETGETTVSVIARLGSTLVQRIRFNYRPRHIAVLGPELSPLVETLEAAGFGSNLVLDRGEPLPVPMPGSWPGAELFRRAVAAAAPRENLATGYDRITAIPMEQKPGAGGSS